VSKTSRGSPIAGSSPPFQTRSAMGSRCGWLRKHSRAPSPTTRRRTAKNEKNDGHGCFKIPFFSPQGTSGERREERFPRTHLRIEPPSRRLALFSLSSSVEERAGVRSRSSFRFMERGKPREMNLLSPALPSNLCAERFGHRPG